MIIILDVCDQIYVYHWRCLPAIFCHDMIIKMIHIIIILGSTVTMKEIDEDGNHHDDYDGKL